MTSERWLSLAGLGALSVLLIGVSFFKPGTSALLPPCPFHFLTGWFCPGCGSTRMLYYLVHGDFIASFRQNPLAFVALPFVAAGLVNTALPLDRRLRFAFFSRLYPVRAWPLTLLIAVIAYTILRNIPYWPACTLAPGGC